MPREESQIRVIKRYANRKLYDTRESRYVTLEQIGDRVRAGEEVQIVDNASKEDLTAVTLAQIIFEQEKRKSFLPLATMRTLIQSGGPRLQEVLSQAGDRVRSVFRRGERGEEEGAAEAGAGAADGAAAASETKASGEPARDGVRALRELLDRSQQAFDEWQKKVDERVRQTVESLSPLSALQKEIAQLQGRIADLERKLGEGEGGVSER